MKPEPWQRLVMDTLYELGDESFQERVWQRQEGGEVSSPNESVNQLFDDSGLGDLLEGGRVFSDEADLVLRKLSELVGEIDLDRPIEDLLADDEWLKVRRLATQALHEVKKALNED